MTFEMLLRMTAATLLYIAAVALAYRFCRGRERTSGWKMGVGLFFGLCSVASNHLGFEYSGTLLNVRDIGPLAAGLFFDPLSGILAGLIGGVERYLIGEYFFIGYFTRLACGVSTVLAGFLAAVLRVRVYRGKRPSVVHAFMAGALTEVVHMYAILVTNADYLYSAYAILNECAVPMIVFTALGMAGCSAAVLRLSGEAVDRHLFQPPEKTPIFVHFQRQLVILTVLLFAFSTATGYFSQSLYAREMANDTLEYQAMELQDLYESAKEDAEEDAEAQLISRIRDVNALADTSIFLVDTESSRILSNPLDPIRTLPLDPADRAVLRAHEKDRHPFMAELDLTLDMTSLVLVRRLSERLMLVVSYSVSLMQNGWTVQLYDSILSDILIFSFLYLLVSLLVEHMVVRQLRTVNTSLGRIIGGKLDETVEVRTSLEFAELSGDINRTVGTLRGYIDEAEKRMEKDLRLAAEIQDSALPKVFSYGRKDYELYALMHPAREVGGDFYDFFFLSRDLLALVIADVSGKSVPAAMFMMRSKTAIKNFAAAGAGPAEILSRVNAVLCEGNDAEMFVTVWLGLLDLRTGHMRCANAGHEYPVLMRAGGRYELLKDRHSLALAAMEGAPMKEYELDLTPGDRIFVYTDGVPEAINGSQEAYGTQRLVDRLNEFRESSPQETLEGILRDVREFAGPAEQFDDITMLGLTWTGPQEKAP